jgi:uncharacterized protein Yka (UPF0111/DUF47 family)
MLNLKPKEDKFYKTFSDSAKNVNEAAIILRANLDSLSNKEIDVAKTEHLEDKGTKLVQCINKELNEAFITPIDREDVYTIVKEMDNILDLINCTMHRFIMFDINESTKESRLIGDMLVHTTKELVKLMDELKINGCKSKHLTHHISNIGKFEVQADNLFRKTVKELFQNEKDPLIVIKWKEIYQILENTIDNCKKVANIVEGVVIKHA